MQKGILREFPHTIINLSDHLHLFKIIAAKLHV